MSYKVFNATDFSGGYATDLSPEKMPDNMLQTAENIVWREGIVNRGGYNTYSTLTTGIAFTAVRGMFRGYLNSQWVNVYALEHTAENRVNFYVSSGSTVASTSLSTAYYFTTGANVEFAQLNDNIVAVNGVDRPVTIYYSTAGSASTIMPLDLYDTRTLTSWDWFAGFYDVSETTQFIDYSTEAYSTGGTNFTLTSGAGDGFYVASPYQFSKLVLTSYQGSSAAASTANMAYWTGSAWTTMASSLVPQPFVLPTSGTTGATTCVFDYLPLWTKYTSTAVPLLANKYAVRVTYDTAPATPPKCSKVTVGDTHRLTRDMGDDRPSKVLAHNSILWLAAGNNVYWSRPNTLTDWNAILNAEYFTEGGKEITAMISQGQYLLLFKESAIYAFYGSYFDNPTKTKLSNLGSPYGRSVATVGQSVMFLANDGVRLWTGGENILVSKHIRSDIESFTKTGACAIFYKGEYWLSFPQNSTPYILVTDPDTLKKDDSGDGRVSWYKFTSVRADQLIYNDGAGDNGWLQGMSNASGPSIIRYDNGNPFDTLVLTTTEFTKTLKTKDISFGRFQEYKNIRRFAPDLLPGGKYIWTMSPDLYSTAADVVTTFATSGTTSLHFSTYVTPPYQMDGKSIAVKIVGNTTDAYQVFGFGVEADVRRY